MQAFETERLIVRRLRWDDIETFYLLCSDPEIIRYMDGGEPLSREQTERWIDASLENYEERGWGCFGVTTRTEDSLIGFAGFARPADRPGIIEIIYAILPSEWGKGYATEVGLGLIDFGFEHCGLKRLEATVNAANDASKRVLEKIGMTYEKRVTEADGEIVDYFAVERVAVV